MARLERSEASLRPVRAPATTCRNPRSVRDDGPRGTAGAPTSTCRSKRFDRPECVFRWAGMSIPISRNGYLVRTDRAVRAGGRPAPRRRDGRSDLPHRWFRATRPGIAERPHSDASGPMVRRVADPSSIEGRSLMDRCEPIFLWPGANLPVARRPSSCGRSPSTDRSERVLRSTGTHLPASRRRSFGA